MVLNSISTSTTGTAELAGPLVSGLDSGIADLFGDLLAAMSAPPENPPETSAPKLISTVDPKPRKDATSSDLSLPNVANLMLPVPALLLPPADPVPAPATVSETPRPERRNEAPLAAISAEPRLPLPSSIEAAAVKVTPETRDSSAFEAEVVSRPATDSLQRFNLQFGIVLPQKEGNRPQPAVRPAVQPLDLTAFDVRAIDFQVEPLPPAVPQAPMEPAAGTSAVATKASPAPVADPLCGDAATPTPLVVAPAPDPVVKTIPKPVLSPQSTILPVVLEKTLPQIQPGAPLPQAPLERETPAIANGTARGIVEEARGAEPDQPTTAVSKAIPGLRIVPSAASSDSGTPEIRVSDLLLPAHPSIQAMAGGNARGFSQQDAESGSNKPAADSASKTQASTTAVLSVAPQKFETQLGAARAPQPVTHVMDVPQPLHQPAAHRVSIDIGDNNSRVTITLHERGGDVSMKIHSSNEPLKAELQSSVGSLVEALHREHVSVTRMDFTSGFASTADPGQHGHPDAQPQPPQRPRHLKSTTSGASVEESALPAAATGINIHV